ncbi:MAG: hypothetical protein CVT64_02165 [Actinobacteria bacterium HGW-Actinobacteria-4]|nr:MAG: hypothetical protein CVT64_02165 [Actinobacteria bacterium HGW-Actinobacteria-4]
MSIASSAHVPPSNSANPAHADLAVTTQEMEWAATSVCEVAQYVERAMHATGGAEHLTPEVMGHAGLAAHVRAFAHAGIDQRTELARQARNFEVALAVAAKLFAEVDAVLANRVCVRADLVPRN